MSSMEEIELEKRRKALDKDVNGIRCGAGPHGLTCRPYRLRRGHVG